MSIDVEKTPVSSEAIIAELLNDIKTSEKAFTVDKLAGCDETGVVEEKRKKHKHRHRSKKRKKERKRSRTYSDSSRSRSRSRNRSRERKKSNKKRKISRSRSRSREKDSKNKQKENVSDKKSYTPDKESQEKIDDGKVESPSKFHELTKKESGDEATVVANFISPIVKKDPIMEISITSVFPKLAETVQNQEFEDGEIEDYVYGISNELSTSMPSLSTEKLEKALEDENEMADKEQPKDKEKGKEKDKDKKKKKEKKRKRSSSCSRDKTKRDSKSARSRSRSRDRRVRRRSPSPMRVKRDERPRRRSVSRDRRARSAERPSRWRSRSRERREYDAYKRNRSRSREVIDKERLLAIAKTKRAEMMSKGDRDNASIEDFVTYCKKLQKRQEREKRREAGQAVSDHDSDGETVRYKHPYAMPKDPIRINIVTATSLNLAQKALTGPEETTQLGASQLRIVFPVSSGAVHKENAEWIPVEKEEVPKSCSNEQKKHIALSSLEIDRCRAQGIPVAPVPVPKFLNSILPPPPAPPQFLPNPSDPFRPPTPPSLPSVLYVPTKENMILKEPKDIAMPAPSDIGKVLKQRTEAQRKVLNTPNDFEAHRALREANEQISLWAALKSLPGEYTGTTGLRLLTADELQPHNPKFHAWVRKSVPICDIFFFVFNHNYGFSTLLRTTAVS